MCGHDHVAVAVVTWWDGRRDLVCQPELNSLRRWCDDSIYEVDPLESRRKRDDMKYTKPHTLTAVVDQWGEVRLTLLCPYTMGEERPCKMGMEAQRCDWHDYENGSHHDDCPAAKDRSVECIAPADSPSGCWPEEPEECDGFYAGEVGHVHECDGCWALELIAELNWDEAVRWRPKVETTLTLPVDVTVTCDNDDGVELSLWSGQIAAEPR